MTLTSRPSRGLYFAAFFVVWFVWGTSYLATKVMVGVWPPLLSAGLRFVAGGLILLGVALWRRESLPASAREWRHVAVMSSLGVLISNALNTLAMQHVASNVAALVNASAALWIAAFGMFGREGHRPSPRVTVGLALGMLGVALIVLPRGPLLTGNLGGQLAMLTAAATWALATFYYRQVQPRTPMLMFSALQMTLGGVVLTIIALLLGEAPQLHFSWPGLLAWIYLVIFASCLGYTAFLYLTVRTTPAKLGTYAYVNPLVATLVGWWLLRETLTSLQLLGTVVIIAGVMLVTLPQRELPAEPGGV
jgi:drug/metabolite transporter (DMT)-like permease